MKHVAAIIFLLAVALLTVRPILSPGYFPMHDDTQVGRVIAMGRALKEGQFPVRWVADLGYGYGYPLYNFYAPLPYYAGGALYAAGLSGLTATKIMFLLGAILPAVTVYAAAVGYVGIIGALVASIFTVFAPYHAVQMYVRGAAGEYWTLVFIPLMLLGAWQSSDTKKRWAPLIGGLGLTGVILSHTLLGFVAALATGAVTVVSWITHLGMRRRNILLPLRLTFMLVTGLGLSAFFWLPAFTEMGYTTVSRQVSASANFADHFVCIGQLWNSPWGFGGSAPGCTDGMSFKVGKLALLLSLLSLFIVWKRKSINERVFGISAIVLFVLSAIMTLPVSLPLWQAIPQFAYLQYPWRFLTGVVLGSGLLAGTVVAFAGSSGVRGIVGLIAVILLLSTNAKLFTPKYTYQIDAAAFESSEDLRWRVSKISDEYLTPAIVVPDQKEAVVSATIPQGVSYSVQTIRDTAAAASWQVDALADTVLTVQRMYFPGWEYRINGARVDPILIHGLPSIALAKGTSRVDISFQNTPVRSAGNIITLVSIVSLCIYYGTKKKTFG
jgi:hypothetical protein